MRSAPALLLILAAACSLPGRATDPRPALAPRAGPAIQISGASPFDCGPPGAPTRNAAVEPSLAVDPKNPSILVAAWQQDRATGSSLGGIVTGRSLDGGSTWTTAVMPGLTDCTGGPFTGTSDPWVSIGPDGTAYLTALGLRTGGARFGGIVASTSSDHGLHWSHPVPVVANDDPLNAIDKEVVLADSRHPGTAYCVWVLYRLHAPTDNPTISSTQFSRTSDGGRTWSPPRRVYGAETENQNHLLNQLPDGSLLDAFTEASVLPGADDIRPLPVRVRAMRSTDSGETWSSPSTVATFTDSAVLDPADGRGLRLTGQENATAAGADGNAYTAWFENDRQAASRILVSRSGDGGRSWEPAVVAVQGRSQVLPPTLAVAGDGSVGLLWYDFRNFHGAGPLQTDAWLTISRDHGRTWREIHLAGPFDLRSAPLASGGPFVGDYEGLVGLPRGFAIAFGQARPAAVGGSAAIFFCRVSW